MSDQQPTIRGVLIETSVGAMVLELYWDHTPKTCKNFYELAKKGYYNGVIFHRIIRVCALAIVSLCYSILYVVYLCYLYVHILLLKLLLLIVETGLCDSRRRPNRDRERR